MKVWVIIGEFALAGGEDIFEVLGCYRLENLADDRVIECYKEWRIEPKLNKFASILFADFSVHETELV